MAQRLAPRHRLPAVMMCGGLAALAACGSDTLKAPAPRPGTLVAAETTPPPRHMSVVDTPIRFALAPALAALEQLVPRKFGDIETRLAIASNSRQHVAFQATRTPFRVAFDGRQLTLRSTVSYQGRGWYKPPLAPTISSSCGTVGSPPRLRVVIEIDVDLARDWRLHTHSRLPTVRPETMSDRDACKVTLFKIDVTDRVVGTVRSLLEQKLPTIDRQIASFDIRSRMDRWYNLLNKSIHVHDSLWLVLSPQELRLGGLRLADDALIADVRLYAQPALVSGSRPPRMQTPLPPLDRAVRDVGDSALLRLQGLMPYALASDMLAKELVGRTVRRYGRSLQLSSLRVYPLGDGRLVLAVGVNGDIVGNAYLVGTPRLDTLTRMLTVPDLDFDVATADALVRGLAWLRKADLVSLLRQRARVPLDPLLDATRRQVEHAINRELAPGIRLSGHIHTGRLVDIAVLPDWLMVRAEATGSLGLGIDREIAVPKHRRVR